MLVETTHLTQVEYNISLDQNQDHSVQDQDRFLGLRPVLS